MNRRTARAGFTLVEILAAMTFLGVLMPVVIGALLISNRAALVAERSTIAMQLGENRLAEMMLDDAWSSEGARGEFGEQWPGYRWELGKADWEAGAMTELTLAVFFQVQGSEHEVRLSTLASESLAATP